MSFAFPYPMLWYGTVMASLAIRHAGVPLTHDMHIFDNPIPESGALPTFWRSVEVTGLSNVNGRLYCDTPITWRYVQYPSHDGGDNYIPTDALSDDWQIDGVIFHRVGYLGGEAGPGALFIDGPGFPFTPLGQQFTFDPSGIYIADYAV